MTTGVQDRQTRQWMALSGATGFIFFVLVNFTKVLSGWDLTIACIQIAINFLVFLAWGRGYRNSSGLIKFVALVGTVVPVIMATTTFIHVLLPALFHIP